MLIYKKEEGRKEASEVNWTKLFEMQNQLDEYIAKTQNIEANDELFTKKILALLVELGELANETRCFKFWSTKKSSEREIVLEEYVDGIHFILSLGISKNFTITPQETREIHNDNLTKQFLDVFAKGINFKQTTNQNTYNELVNAYLSLGYLLGFDPADIETAYVEKNEVNFARQDQGY